MLINRRQALISIGLTAFSGVAWSLPGPLRPPLWEETHLGSDAEQATLSNTVDDRLREDLARLAPRAYSEEGIPVFLACMNLVPAKISHQPARVSLTPLSATLASSFRRNAEAFRRMHPNADARDIAPIIEVLAERDFTKGGAGEEL